MLHPEVLNSNVSTNEFRISVLTLLPFSSPPGLSSSAGFFFPGPGSVTLTAIWVCSGKWGGRSARQRWLESAAIASHGHTKAITGQRLPFELRFSGMASPYRPCRAQLVRIVEGQDVCGQGEIFLWNFHSNFKSFTQQLAVGTEYWRPIPVNVVSEASLVDDSAETRMVAETPDYIKVDKPSFARWHLGDGRACKDIVVKRAVAWKQVETSRGARGKLGVITECQLLLPYAHIKGTSSRVHIGFEHNILGYGFADICCRNSDCQSCLVVNESQLVVGSTHSAQLVVANNGQR